LKKIVYLLLLPGLQQVYAQDAVWTLQSAIRYAQEHNPGLKTAALDARSSKMAYAYSTYNRLPSLSLNTNYGGNYGRSINPTTNAFEQTRFSSVGLSAGANVLLFGWFEKKYAIDKSRLQYQSAGLQVAQQKEELVLTVATAYLRVLLSREQVATMRQQIAISQAGKDRIIKLMEAGKSNVLERSQAATQLSADSSAYFQSLLNQEQAMLDLKVILNLDPGLEMEIGELAAETAGFIEQPVAEEIYQVALLHMPEIRNHFLQTKLAQKEIALSKTNLYPKLSLYVSSGTNYSSSFYEMLPNGGAQLMSFGRQLRNNRAQSVSVGLSVPLFNNLSTRQAIRSAQLALEKVAMEQEASRLKLKQAIYKAVIDYELGRQKYLAAENALSHAGLAFKAAEIRFAGGFINHFEYLTEQNKLLKIRNEVTALKYEFYFKKLVIDYYKGAFNTD